MSHVKCGDTSIDSSASKAEETAADAQARATVIQGELNELRTEISTLRADMRAAVMRNTEHGAQLMNIQESLASLKASGNQSGASSPSAKLARDEISELRSQDELQSQLSALQAEVRAASMKNTEHSTQVILRPSPFRECPRK